MAEALDIRVARAEEHEAVSAIIRAAYAEYEATRAPDRWQRYIDNAADVSSRLDKSELLVAELDSELVGCITFYPPATASAAGGWPEGWVGLRLLAAHPSARGKGVGRALMEASIERARSLGAPVIALHTTEAMAVARAMYERMGFVRIPERDFNQAMAYRLLLT